MSAPLVTIVAPELYDPMLGPFNFSSQDSNLAPSTPTASLVEASSISSPQTPPGEYEVLAIVGSRKTGRDREFLCSWRGFDKPEWTKASAMMHAAELVHGYATAQVQNRVRVFDDLSQCGLMAEFLTAIREAAEDVQEHSPGRRREPPVPPSVERAKSLHGFPNLGNTCFANATFQMLHCMPGVFSPGEINCDAIDTTAVRWCQTLVNLLMSTSDVTQNISSMREAIGELLGSIPSSEMGSIPITVFGNGQQHDAVDFFLTVSNCVNSCIPGFSLATGFNSVQTTVRNICNHSSVLEDYEYLLNLHVKDCAGFSVKDLMSNPTSSVLVDCIECNTQLNPAKSSLIFANPADFLFVNLNRLCSNGNGIYSKNMEEIERSPSLTFGECHYILTAEILHIGGADGGHYITLRKSPSGILICDDQRLRKYVPEDDDLVLNPRSNSYLLCYEKVTDISKCSDFGLVSTMSAKKAGEHLFGQNEDETSTSPTHSCLDELTRCDSLAQIRSVSNDAQWYTVTNQVFLENLDVLSDMEVVNQYLFAPKRIFRSVPTVALPSVSRMMTHVYNCFEQTGGSEQINDLYVRLLMVSSVVLVKHRHDSEIEAVKRVIRKCWKIRGGGLKEVLEETFKSILEDAPCAFQVAMKNNPSFSAYKFASLIQHGLLRRAREYLGGTEKPRLELTREAKDVVENRFATCGNQPANQISRQQLLQNLKDKGISTDFITLTKNQVRGMLRPGDVDDGGGNFSRNKAPGLSGISNLHIAQFASFQENEPAFIAGLTHVVNSINCGLLSDESMQLLLKSKASLLGHKTGVLEKLKVINVSDSHLRFAQKGPAMKMEGVFRDLFGNDQNAMKRNGALLGPISFERFLEQLPLDQRAREMLVISHDVQKFFPSGIKQTCLEAVIAALEQARRPDQSLSYLYSYSPNLLAHEAVFLSNGEVFVQDIDQGLPIGSVSAMPDACLSVLQVQKTIRDAFKDVILHSYSYADNNAAILLAPNMMEYLDSYNEELAPLGYNCPDSSFVALAPFFVGTDAEREAFQNRYPRVKIVFQQESLSQSDNSASQQGIVLPMRHTEYNGVILEGYAVGSDAFKREHVQKVLDRAADYLAKVSEMRSQKPELIDTLYILRQSLQPTIDFALSATSPELISDLIQNYHASLVSFFQSALGTRLTDHQITQLFLPRTLGGHGFRSPANYASASFIRTMVQVCSQQQMALPLSMTTVILKFNHSVLSEERVNIATATGLNKLRKTSQKELTMAVARKLLSDLRQNLSPDDQKKLQLLQAPGVSAWMTPAYTTVDPLFARSPSKVLAGDDFRTEFLLRLVDSNRQHPILMPAWATAQELPFVEVSCGRTALSTGQACGATLDCDGIHACSSCKTLKYETHNIGVSAICDLCKICELKARGRKTEVGKAGLRVDIIIETVPRALAIDVTVRSPLIIGATPVIDATSLDEMGSIKFNTLHHLTRAEQSKEVKYKQTCIDEEMDFMCFAMNPFGAWGLQTKELFSILATEYAGLYYISVSQSTQMVKRYIQARVMRFQARQITHSFDRIARISLKRRQSQLPPHGPSPDYSALAASR